MTGGSIVVPRRSKASARPRQTVAVFGGGIAGLTATHELAERGFDVTVYERRAWGGKARSTEVPGSATGGRKPLPGEHSIRVFFGFFQNTVDTFRRIPFDSNPNGVFDNLTSFSNLLCARDAGRRDLLVPFGISERPLVTPAEVVDDVVSLLLRETDLPPDGVAHFGRRLLVFFSSCEERRLGQWDDVSWSEFVGADRFNDDYHKIIGTLFSEALQASKAERTSATFSAKVLEWVVYNVLGRNSNGPLWRMLNLPTNEALFDPWLAVLGRAGVDLRLGYSVEGFGLEDGRITGARVSGPAGPQSIVADWYVCALPVERARTLWSPSILAADSQLGRMNNLDTAWANGMKFFLRRPTPIVNGGFHCADSPWLITGMSQAQLWPVDFASTYGDGSVHDCLSVGFLSNKTGVLFGKRGDECSPEEIAAEVWEQIKRHINNSGRTILTDDLVHSWDIDPGMLLRDGRLVSEDPLVLPIVGQRPDRPDVATAIPNLFLAGDYLKSNWEVANMETASYNARRAVTAILGESGSHEIPPAVIEPIRPAEWEPLKKIDEQLFRAGQPNLFDVEVIPAGVQGLLRQPGL